jgi:hypothetical protein
MNIKKFFFRSAAATACGALLAFGIHAGTTVPDVIELKNSAYTEHTKDIVEFKHTAHAEEFSQKYPQVFKNGCGECHHDDAGQPLTDLQYGDAVEGCMACHPKPGEMPPTEKRELRAEGLSLTEIKAKELDYHAEAMHEKCRGCHRRARKEADTRTPPITCSKCHTKDSS